MSESEGDVAVAEVVDDGPMDLNKAIQEVLKQSNRAGGLAKGVREAVKALDRREALLILLATNINEPSYSKLVEALCQEHNIRLLKVDSNKTLGEWCGLCKIDKEGNARKIVGCGVVAVTDYGDSNNPAASQAHAIIEEHFSSQ